MPNTCTVCTHADRTAIEQALAAGAAINQVARTFSLSRTSLQRHARRHLRLPAPKPAAKPATKLAPKPKTTHPKLLQRLDHCYQATARLLHEYADTDPYVALQAIARIEAQCRLLHRLDPHGTLEKPGPDIAQINHLVRAALQPYPEARAALVQALEQVRQTALHCQSEVHSNA